MKVKIESAFLKPDENIKDGDIITFLDEGWEEENEAFGKRQMVITVITPDMEKKKCNLNNTSKLNMRQAYGEDSKSWVSKEARVNIVKQMVGKTMKSVVYLSHPERDLEGNIIVVDPTE